MSLIYPQCPGKVIVSECVHTHARAFGGEGLEGGLREGDPTAKVAQVEGRNWAARS